MKFPIKALCGALLSALLPLTQASALTIDSFDDTCADVTGTCQEATFPGTSSTGLSTTKAIGGTRKLSVARVSGNSSISASSTLGAFLHSQGVGVTGRSLITWDKSTAGATNPQGLGGIDLQQDGGTAIIIKNLNAEHLGSLKMTFFDASDPTGASSWSTTYSLTQSQVDTTFDLVLPFNTFTPDNPGAQVNFGNVGAITLLIDGTPQAALDLQFDLIATNGTCAAVDDVPNGNGLVIDQCGQCISENPALDNRACTDCAGVPNGNSTPGTSCSTGQIGLCAAGTWQLVQQGPPITCQCTRTYQPTPEICDEIDNNCNGQIDESFPLKNQVCGIGNSGCTEEGTYVCDQTGGLFCNATLKQQQVDACEISRGCDGVPGSGLVTDSCGSCGGDGTSCRDCAGTINGTVVTDRCGVCGGDGNSCLDCQEKDIFAIQAVLDNTAKQQEAELKVLYSRIDRVSKGNKKILKLTQTFRAEVHKLQIRNWVISWTFPSITRVCSNTVFCSSVSNEAIWNEYQEHAKRLRDMMVEGVALLKKVQKSKSKSFGSSYIAKMDALYATAIANLKQVPTTQFSCS